MIDWLKVASASAVAGYLRLSWNAVDGIMHRAVKRGLARRQTTPPTDLSVDETSFQRRHEYVTVVTDQTSGAVVYLADDRTKESLDGYFQGLSAEDCSAIESVSMDMWPAYIAVVRRYVPDADRRICFDKFHVAHYLGDAVDRVRRAEHRTLHAEGDERLKGTRYRWLENPDSMSQKNWGSFERLRHSALHTARAWAIKEHAMCLWHYSSRTWALKQWSALLSWAMRSRLDPIKKVALTIRTHLWGIINAIVLKRSNAVAESVNSRIQRVKARACGFRNRQRFRTAISVFFDSSQFSAVSTIFPSDSLPLYARIVCRQRHITQDEPFTERRDHERPPHSRTSPCDRRCRSDDLRRYRPPA